MKAILFTFVFLTLTSTRIQELHILVGTWKVEGKASFETWQKSGDRLIGSSYKRVNNTKKVSETLVIYQTDEHIIYEATVPNQNKGAAIAFTLNKAEKSTFSFENLTHDFPKKIQYKQISKDTLFVSVLGEDNKGFSYRLIRQ